MKKYQILDNCSTWYRLICLEAAHVDLDEGILYCPTISIINMVETPDRWSYGNYSVFPIVGEDYPLILNQDDHEVCISEKSFENEENAIDWFTEVIESVYRS